MKQILTFSKQLNGRNLRGYAVTIIEELKKSGDLEKVENGYMRIIKIPKNKVGLIGSDDIEIIAMPFSQFQSQWNENEMQVKVADYDMCISNYEEVTTFKVSHE